jgi:hypothetical protein
MDMNTAQIIMAVCIAVTILAAVAVLLTLGGR